MTGKSCALATFAPTKNEKNEKEHPYLWAYFRIYHLSLNGFQPEHVQQKR